MNVRLYIPSDRESWDSYVSSHPHSTHCHLSGWKDVIERAYGHKGYYLLAEEDSKIVGLLPLIHLKSFLFGNQLVSMPFLNYGGVLADSDEVAKGLLKETIRIASRLKASSVELRHLKPISYLNSSNRVIGSTRNSSPVTHHWLEKTHKVRMVLALPGSKEELLKSFKAKLRSQILRPQKEGMTVHIGGVEFLDPFYKVFSVNMRDLGSPVHSKRLFGAILDAFHDQVRIGVVEYQNAPVASGLIVCFRDTVEIPWASSLKGFNKFSPNMLLYWSLMEDACDRGFKFFDFGRSTPEEGTYRFKEQWGAEPQPLHWHILSSHGKSFPNYASDKSRFGAAIEIWKKLPLPIAGMLGHIIRKNISL